MLQPTGPQAGPLLKVRLAAEPPVWLLKAEKAFLAWPLPQVGQVNLTSTCIDRTNLSYFFPQS